jgi:hypothetical protein
MAASTSQPSDSGPACYYRVLQLSPSAKPVDIRASYLKLARVWHPDRQGGDEAAKQRFQQIQEAYQGVSTCPIGAQGAGRGGAGVYPAGGGLPGAPHPLAMVGLCCSPHRRPAAAALRSTPAPHPGRGGGLARSPLPRPRAPLASHPGSACRCTSHRPPGGPWSPPLGWEAAHRACGLGLAHTRARSRSHTCAAPAPRIAGLPGALPPHDPEGQRPGHGAAAEQQPPPAGERAPQPAAHVCVMRLRRQVGPPRGTLARGRPPAAAAGPQAPAHAGGADRVWSGARLAARRVCAPE